MKLYLSDLWRWQGTIDRGPYLLWGVILVGVKFNLDRFVMQYVFAQSWSPGSYFGVVVPLHESITSGSFARESATLLLMAIPFLWAGVVLSLRRLRSAGLPIALVLLFVAPWVKWLLFAGLVLSPATDPAAPPTSASTKAPRRGDLGRCIPQSRAGAAGFAVALCALGATAALIVTIEYGMDYSWTVFVGVPFVTGFLAAAIHGYHVPRSLGECIGVAWLSIAITALALLLIAFEGLICLAMAAPIGIVLATVGGMAGYAVQAVGRRGNATRLGGGALAAVPLLFALENAQPAPPPLLEVSSTIEVDAPPEVVWRHVVTFSELPPPTEWLFRTGLAYPVRATIEGTGPGAIRRCEFSTGPFVEPIEIWDEPRLLRFGVTHNPAPMQEWTLYDEIHPPHLDGFLASERGQFALTELPGGRTRLTGTTWYRHHMEPARYWQVWSDYIIHQIHLRVLRHVKQLAEGTAPTPLATPTAALLP